ncbi:MAG: helix-turn-helix domain-containing protein [Burkholderiaceae bacterium]
MMSSIQKIAESKKAESTPGASPFRVVAFGHDASTVRAVGRILEDEPAIQVVLNSGPISTLRETQLLPNYNVALIDIDAGQTSTYAMVKILVSAYPDRPVIGITHTLRLEPVWHAINAGASGVIHQRDFDPSRFVADLPSADDSKSYLSPTVARILLDQLKIEPLTSEPAKESKATISCSEPCPTGRPALSPRECEILKLSAGGHIGKEIATILSVSPHTVTTHFKNIYRKLEVNTRGEAVFRAHAAGLI